VAAAALAPSSPGIGTLVMSIRNDFRATDANSVAALGRAAVDTTNRNAAFREAAAHALAAIHTAAAVPYLGILLSDTDPLVRAEGIAGLSSFANGSPVQTASNTASMAYLHADGAAPYRTADTVANSALGAATISRNEARYLTFWENWWAQNRASLGN
jgi:HEAT repeat protein